MKTERRFPEVRRPIPAFVLTRNHLAWAQDICAKLHQAGCTVIIVDNNSTYKPMVDWLDDVSTLDWEDPDFDKYKIIRLKREMKHISPYVLWTTLIGTGDSKPCLAEYYIKEVLGLKTDKYIVTDSDLDLTLGDQSLELMSNILNGHQWAVKCGPIPSWCDHTKPYHLYEFANEVQSHCAQFRQEQIDMIEFDFSLTGQPGLEDIASGNAYLYKHALDTTFAMYSLNRPFTAPLPAFGPAVVFDSDNLTCIHRPWTIPSGFIMSDPETYYYTMSCDCAVGTWTNRMKSLIMQMMGKMYSINKDIINNLEESKNKDDSTIYIHDEEFIARFDEKTGDVTYRPANEIG